jgi:hypothetical protein
MGLKIELKNIDADNNFKLYYKVGSTPGSFATQSSTTWGTQYTGGTSINGVFSSSTTGITIDLIEENIVKEPYFETLYGQQFWFKIIDVVTNRYIIENVIIHQKIFYDNKCVNC